MSRDRRRDLSIRTDLGYAVARGLSSVSLMPAEIVPAAAEHCVVFAGPDAALVPSAVLGLRAGQNLYVDERGCWQAGYVPALLRRYPFVVAAGADGATYTFCIDEAFDGCDRVGLGQRLFDDAGERSDFVQRTLAFAQPFQAAYRRTVPLCRRLQDLDPLGTGRAQIAGPNRRRIDLGGCRAVGPDRLERLDPTVLAELVRSDAPEVVDAHLQTMRHLAKLAEDSGLAAAATALDQPPAGTA